MEHNKESRAMTCNPTKNFSDEPGQPSGEWAEPLNTTEIPASTDQQPDRIQVCAALIVGLGIGFFLGMLCAGILAS
jgi:hypothetical protein